MLCQRWLRGSFLGLAGLLPGLAVAGPAATPPAAAPAGRPAVQPSGPAQLDVMALEGQDSYSLSAANAELRAILEALSKASGSTLRAEGNSTVRVSVTLANEPLDRAVEIIARAAGFVPTRTFAITRRKEGEALPERFTAPVDLPAVTMALAAPTPIADAIAALRTVTRFEITVAPDVQGQATIDAQEMPLPEVLDALCEQADAIWRIGYRLRPDQAKRDQPAAARPADQAAQAATNPAQGPMAATPGQTAPAPGQTAPARTGTSAARRERTEIQAAQRDMVQWAKTPPAERQQAAQRDIADLMGAFPDQRRRRGALLLAPVLRASRGLDDLFGPDRKRMEQAVVDRVSLYLGELKRLPPQQQSEMQWLSEGFQRVLEGMRGGRR